MKDINKMGGNCYATGNRRCKRGCVGQLVLTKTHQFFKYLSLYKLIQIGIIFFISTRVIKLHLKFNQFRTKNNKNMCESGRSSPVQHEDNSERTSDSRCDMRNAYLNHCRPLWNYQFIVFLLPPIQH